MRRVLIDTNVYAAFKQNRNDIVSAFQQLDYIAIDVTVIAELLCGFKFGTREKQNRKDLEPSVIICFSHQKLTANPLYARRSCPWRN